MGRLRSYPKRNKLTIMKLLKAIQILEEYGYHISIITNTDGNKAHKKGDKSYALLEEAIKIVLQELKK